MIKPSHAHACPIDAGVALPRNIEHGEYQRRWLRGLDREAAAQWRPPRDSQRSRLYRAEERAARVLSEPGLGTVAATQAFVDEVVGSPWWHRVAPHRPTVLVGDGRGRRSGGSVGGEIRLPVRFRTRLVVLHELAHEWVLCPVRPAHGPDFATALLALVAEFHSVTARELLEASFEVERVRTASYEP